MLEKLVCKHFYWTFLSNNATRIKSLLETRIKALKKTFSHNAIGYDHVQWRPTGTGSFSVNYIKSVSFYIIYRVLVKVRDQVMKNWFV